ncbi:MAG: hypothetical protein ACNA8R_02760 [Nitriliruptoraceae bacterium]
MSVHRAEVVSRPGRLVRLTRVSDPVAAEEAAALVTDWQVVTHPALLAVDRVWHGADGLVLEDRAASARPLDTFAAGTLALTPGELARAGARIAAALTALHEHGLTHQAVSLHTILLGSDGGALLDGPWHAGCHPAPDPTGTDVANGPRSPRTTAEGDARALASTLLALLASAQQPDPAAPHLAALRSLLQEHTRQPADARLLRDALEAWHGTRPPDAAPVHDRVLSRPGAGRGDPGHRVEAGHGRQHRTRLGIGATVALVAALGVALLRGGPAPPVTDPLTEPSAGTTSTSGTSEPERPSPATSAAGARRAEATPVAVRPICPAPEPPPGPGRLVLADLDGRGCRAAVRIDGARLAVRGPDLAAVEVTLDLEPDDQVLLGDLDGTGRDEVLVYRPSTGELFRFAGLAGPGEAVTATGQASGWVGGTAALTVAPDGRDRLEVRGGTPS